MFLFFTCRWIRAMFVLTFSPLGEKVNTNMALIHRQVKKSTLGKIVNNYPLCTWDIWSVTVSGLGETSWNHPVSFERPAPPGTWLLRWKSGSLASQCVQPGPTFQASPGDQISKLWSNNCWDLTGRVMISACWDIEASVETLRLLENVPLPESSI